MTGKRVNYIMVGFDDGSWQKLTDDDAAGWWKTVGDMSALESVRAGCRDVRGWCRFRWKTGELPDPMCDEGELPVETEAKAYDWESMYTPEGKALWCFLLLLGRWEMDYQKLYNDILEGRSEEKFTELYWGDWGAVVRCRINIVDYLDRAWGME